MKRVCIFCGSKKGVSNKYESAALKACDFLADQKLDLVFGGGKVGLMGIAADRFLQRGQNAIGVIPRSLVEAEVAHQGLSELIIVENMHQRKNRIYELSDFFMSLPGGYGTLDETFEILTWAQLAIHNKPVALLNAAGYYDGLLKFLDHCSNEGFLHPNHRTMLIAEATIENLWDRVINYVGPTVSKAQDALR